MYDFTSLEIKEEELEEGLYVVGTPIGNLSDISLRALNILNMVDLILCEDTRRTSKLLSKYHIQKKLISCYGYNEKKVSERLKDILSGKKVAYVSDSGTPGISDPGEIIVNKAYELGFKVIPVPGASALASMLSVCGFLKKDIHFFGFLPVKKGRRGKFIEKIKHTEGIVVIYESPYRVRKLLLELYELLGDVYVVLGRELTKIYEDVCKKKLSEFVNNIDGVVEKGEYVLCLEM